MIRIFIVVICIFYSTTTFGQSLTLSELISFVKMDVSDVNDYLLKKKWTYSNSLEIGESYRTSWGYDISTDSKASNWLYIESKEGKLNWVIYDTVVQRHYLSILELLRKSGVKKFSSKIGEEGELISLYVGKQYTYQLKTVKQGHSIIVFNSSDVIDSAFESLKEETVTDSVGAIGKH